MFDANAEIKNIIEWIRNWFAENGPKADAMIGISGGKDSTIVAKLLVEALGADRVYGVLMPNGEQKDIADSLRVVELLGIQYEVVNIKAAVDGVLQSIKTVSNDAIINTPPRVRMTTLYAIGAGRPNGGRVCNTCNFSEDYVGYSTKFGDAAGDFSPCSAYTVTDMLQIGDALGLPYELIHKTPSDGLCGQTDEDKLGFTYAELDEYIRTGKMENVEKKNKIDRMHLLNLHKLKPLPMCKKLINYNVLYNVEN